MITNKILYKIIKNELSFEVHPKARFLINNIYFYAYTYKKYE